VKTIGLCLGASRISLAAVEVVRTGSINRLTTVAVSHNGNVTDTLQNLLTGFNGIPSRIAVTGRKFRDKLDYPAISEGEAVEFAFSHLQHKYNGCDTIVSAGGEAFVAYKLDRHGKICDVFTGNKCASGTGEFFLQQLKRMDLTVEQAMSLVDLDNPYLMAGRCSVFCKSDCTHALNKGEPKNRVVSGLCKMMAGKILELAQKCRSNKLLLTGGTANNSAMVEFVRRGLDKPRTLVVAGEADYFEALGTAVWAASIPDDTFSSSPSRSDSNKSRKSFAFLPGLKDFEEQVTFSTWTTASPENGDRCIVGTDVGSTTTKAVVMREKDSAVLASIYLRTNGDPVEAARNCYRALAFQLPCPVKIIGLGVTGSGRQIAGLHAGTAGIVNEILAHATAAVHFDPDVDTIFEIGGQDAKYTFLVNGVPADYAMNEACSAGTGSFLEEAAKETMGVDHSNIAELALNGTHAPNFNDQCAAFIGSDIKNAIQEGIPTADILAGLVYSVCQNYSNRVKGNRPVGNKVFMQGGVCYNRAVPMAMAAISGKKIVVPPEPGLMGAYGVALEIKRKIEQDSIKEQRFDLTELADRTVSYGKPFACSGGKDGCDRKCSINVVEIDGTRYPFGGACNKYVNLRHNVGYDVEQLDFVAKREQLVFKEYVSQAVCPKGRQRIGLTKALLSNSLFPLYYNFFSRLG
jgi:predicted CoA-substrate-specific enzyme activase